MLANEL